MAAVTMAVTASVSSSSSLRSVGRIREGSFCPRLESFCSSSSCASVLRFSASQWRKRHGGGVLVACLPSTPKSGTTTPSTKLYVSGLSFRTTEESLRNAFQNFGQLVEVNLVMDRIANRPRGFAFLRYATEEESKQAIEGMHGKFLDGRVIFVEYAKPRSELRQNFKRSPTQY